MERPSVVNNQQYIGYIYRLRALDVKHLGLSQKYRTGEVSEEELMSGYKKIERQRDMVIVRTARHSLKIDDQWVRTAAFNVLVCYATEGLLRPVTRVSFLRVSGMSSQLSHFK